MTKKSYQTKGKQELIRFLSENPDRQLTAEEICLAINGSAEKGKSTVYRLLSTLCEEDAVRKFRGNDGTRSVYQYVGASCDCKLHFHQKCLECGRLQHLDCHGTEDFTRHLLTEHGFAVDCGKTVLYGLCAQCRQNMEVGGRA